MRRNSMKKPLPREGFVRPGPGEHDTTDVEGHGNGDSLRLPIEQGIPGAPGSDGISGLPRTSGEFAPGDDDDTDMGGPTRAR
jgi:hypothetical protein